MSNILIGIPSYFGTGNVRNKRITAHKEQLDWIELLGYETIIYAQNYRKYEYFSMPNVTYKKFSKNAHWAIFKTMFLKEFYKTDYIWGIVMDNDAALYDHQLGYNIFHHMEEYPDLWKDVDLWYPLDPRKEPFTYMYNQYPRFYEKYIMLKSSPVTAKGTMFVIKNPKYSKKEPIYYDKQYSSDDTHLIIQAYINKYKVFKNTSTVLKELVDSKRFSTITWLNDIKERAESVKKEKLFYAEKYKIPHVIRKDGGVTLKSKQFAKKCLGKEFKENIQIPRNKY